MKKSRQIDLTPDELEGLMHRLDAGTLTAEDNEIIKAIIETFLTLNQAVRDKDGKINKLLRMIFGAKTEKADNVLTSESQDEAGTDNTGEKADKPKGHGRNGTSEYTGAEKVFVPHAELKPGDR